jgi:hypothetical protein
MSGNLSSVLLNLQSYSHSIHKTPSPCPISIKTAPPTQFPSQPHDPLEFINSELRMMEKLAVAHSEKSKSVLLRCCDDLPSLLHSALLLLEKNHTCIKRAIYLRISVLNNGLPPVL